MERTFTFSKTQSNVPYCGQYKILSGAESGAQLRLQGNHTTAQRYTCARVSHLLWMSKIMPAKYGTCPQVLLRGAPWTLY
ncbi:unnamed protein product [Toxocara canis]|uniref:Uncharacterized protein n=1 Tax=Toxocara canis TaxID=6265 RepID=A0A183UFQ2_TOXCA|nr:unnamed protein product [Toxocara canis]